MPLKFSTPARPSDMSHRIIRRSLLLIVIFMLLTYTLAAQTDQATMRATAQRLLIEGVLLREEGSKESLQQAIQKFAAAQPLFHALNDSSSEAVTLLARGDIYGTLGDNQKALDYL